LQAFEYEFYSCFMSSLAPDHLPAIPIIAPATPSAHGWRLTAEEEATAVAELQQAAVGWAALLAECAGLALGYGEHQPGAARYRNIAELCVAAGVDQALVETWIEAGRQRASAAAVTIHKACVLWDKLTLAKRIADRPVGERLGKSALSVSTVARWLPSPADSSSQ
jgi:hypothetical protein